MNQVLLNLLLMVGIKIDSQACLRSGHLRLLSNYTVSEEQGLSRSQIN